MASANLAYPDPYKDDFSDMKIAKEAIDYAINKFDTRTRNSRYNKCYDSYNGIVKDSVFNFLTNTYGKSSRTKYVDYRLGRSKVKKIIGEFLEADLAATVRTTNREANNQKFKEYKKLIGMAEAKPYVETVRNVLGMDAFAGVNFPDKNSEKFQEMKKVKLINEKVMQHLIDSKIVKERMKLKFLENITDVTIVAECYGKVERNISGVDTYRVIQPKNAMYEESDNDPLISRTPYMGEYRRMFAHEIYTTFKLDKTQKQMIEDGLAGINECLAGHIHNIDGEQLIDTFTIEMKSVKPIRIKYEDTDKGKKFTNIISEDTYEEKYKNRKNVETVYKETLWTVSRIGKDIYCAHFELKDQIQTRMGGPKFHVMYNYCGLLQGTVDGIRISLYEIGIDLSQVYNFIRFAINRELSKIKGKVITYDKAYLPDGKNMADIMYQMTEDSVVEYSSAEAGIDDEEDSGKRFGPTDMFKEVDLGASQGLQMLIMAGQDIERVLDRLTGMNDSRQGISKASKTATGVQSDIASSVSQTYDIFYYFQQYTDMVLTKLAEKTKINHAYLKYDIGALELGDDEKQFIEITKNISWDDYACVTSDGRKEVEIKERIRMLYEAQINAKELRAQDIARAEMQDTFIGFLEALDKGWNAIIQQRMEEAKQASKANSEDMQQQMKSNREIMEDQQSHEKEKIIIKGDIDTQRDREKNQIKKEIEMMKASLSDAGLSKQIISKIMTDIMKKNIDLEKIKSDEKKAASKPKPKKK